MKYIAEIVLACLLITSCTSGPLKAPCPQFGAYCHKRPVNAWNYQNAAVF